jgi:hypothetical protein
MLEFDSLDNISQFPWSSVNRVFLLDSALPHHSEVLICLVSLSFSCLMLGFWFIRCGSKDTFRTLRQHLDSERRSRLWGGPHGSCLVGIFSFTSHFKVSSKNRESTTIFRLLWSVVFYLRSLVLVLCGQTKVTCSIFFVCTIFCHRFVCHLTLDLQNAKVGVGLCL